MPVFGSLVVAMTVLFLLVEVLEVRVLTDADPLDSENEMLAAGAIAVALLVVDVFLPVPSSVVMVACR